MKNLRLDACVTWAVLFKMASALANRRVFQPYGPVMCKRLEERCNVLSSMYHVDTLTCIIHVDQVLEVNRLKTCAKIEGCVSLSDCVQDKTYPRLFFAENNMDRPTITIRDWTTGHKKRTFLLDDQVTSLTCSHSNKTIYFVFGYSNKHIVGSIDSRGKLVHILNIDNGDTIAVDSRKGYIFVGSRRSAGVNRRRQIWRYDLSREQAIPKRFTFTQSIESLIGIEAEPDMELIYIGTTTSLYKMMYTGQAFHTYYSWKSKMTSIAYDPSRQFLYSLHGKDVKRRTYTHKKRVKREQVMTCEEKPLAFDVHQALIFLANKKAILAMDLKSNTSVWSIAMHPRPYVVVC